MALKKKKLAAIDMGSNSFHLLMAEVSMTGFFPNPDLTRHKQKVSWLTGLTQQIPLMTTQQNGHAYACQVLPQSSNNSSPMQ